MSIRDEIAIANERLWEEEVRKGCGYTIPWLDLDINLLQRYANGQLDDPAPHPYHVIYPSSVLASIKGKDVLCLAAGGGQQSATFGLLGANVTVVDLAEGQISGDRTAAEHYGYEINAIKGDMRDLSFLDDVSFDLVYSTAMAYIPDVRQVYAGVASVLRTGGIYRVDFNNPVTQGIRWDGRVYYIAKPYVERYDPQENGAIETRHYLSDIFNGLMELDFSIQQVCESLDYKIVDPEAQPGDWHHQQTYVAGQFVIVAQKN